MTTAEWMELRFGSGRQGRAARLLSALANLVVTVAMLTYFVKGTGKFLAVFLPFEPAICSLAMIAIALVYTTLAGLYGVVLTDVLQELIIIVAALYIGYEALTLPEHGAVLAAAGENWSSLTPRWRAEPMTWLTDPGIYRMFGLCIVFWIARGLFEGAGGLTGGYMPQRYYAAPSDRDAGLMTGQWILLLLVRWVLVTGTAVLALGLVRSSPSLAELLHADPEKVLPVVLGQAVPAGLRGLTVAGLVAAAMSTFDSTVNAGAAYWVRDIYQVHLRPAAGHNELINQSYAATLVLAGAGAGLGLTVHNIDEIWGWITGPLSAGLFAPIVLRWYWWRMSGYGFALATACGLVCAVLLKIIAPEMPLYLSFPLTWTCSALAGVLGSLGTAPTSSAVLARFWLKVRPFGLWSAVRRDLDPALVAASRSENRLDLLSVPLAVAWHLSGVIAVISLVLRKWQTLGAAATVWALGGLGLYRLWLRRLPPEKDSRPG
jgi:Na+/proline symporter